MTYYPERDQDLHYRLESWAAGCTCPMMPAHVHLPACPMHETPAQLTERLEAEHLEDQ